MGVTREISVRVKGKLTAREPSDQRASKPLKTQHARVGCRGSCTWHCGTLPHHCLAYRRYGYRGLRPNCRNRVGLWARKDRVQRICRREVDAFRLARRAAMWKLSTDGEPGICLL